MRILSVTLLAVLLSLLLIRCGQSKHGSVSPPLADFIATPTSGTAPLTVQFTDTSTGNITSWAWDFDNDGMIDSTQQNPTHIYAIATVYTVSLTVTGPGGSEQEVKANYITVWFVKTWGGGVNDELDAVAVDSAANIYCAGCTQSFGAGSYDALLLKYESSGALGWAKTWGGSNDDFFHAVAVDSSGNMYCAGRTSSFGGGSDDALLLKYNSSGTLQWAKTWGGSGWDHLFAVAVDSSGNIYCAGTTSSFGAGDWDALLLKYDSSGTLQSATTWGGSSSDSLDAVVVDSCGNIYCAGSTASFGAGSYAFDALLLKYDSSGTVQRAATWGGSSHDYLYALAVDSGGSIYCAGLTWSLGLYEYDALVLKYDGSGTLQWTTTWGGSGQDYLGGVAADSSGNIYCAGYTGSFGSGDALLLKYDSSGALQWSKTCGGADNDWVSAVAVDSTGNVYLGGATYTYTGIWQEVTTGSQTSPSATSTTPSGTAGSPSGAEDSPVGTQTTPTGSETGAGGLDTLLLRNW